MTKQPRQRKIAIVGVGASAGGVEALEAFLRGTPRNPGFAVVVVTHLGPDRESHLHEILQRYTELSVQVATDGVQVKANCVYVLATDALLGIERGRLRVSEVPAGKRERKPIDIFLSALAKDAREYSAAVILSGGDGDGTLGLKAVKERGGLALAQTASNGDGPSHPDMPASAIATGFVDFAIPAAAMGAKLAEFAAGLRFLEKMTDDDEASSATNLVADGAHAEICTILRNQIGHDFSGYKVKTFLRRVQRRMQVTQMATVEAYLEHLRRDTREVNALFRDLLINVTNFFRDADAFEKLKELVIPKLFENRGADDTVRVWVPGCATGEEVFSIAMLIREHMDTLKGLPRVQVFATDIDEHALNVARAARYPEALLDTVSPERLQRFFIKDAGSYVLSKDVRDLCIFSPHSVIRDPPFSRIDLISCRNLLIYFGPDIQSQVVPTFHYSLRAGGYLFLGTSENVSQFTELFTPLEKKHRIFRAKEDHAGVARLPLALTGLRPAAPALSAKAIASRGIALRQNVEAQVLERFAPAHVVANRDGEIVYYSARTGRYLEATAGTPTRELFTLARRGLRLDLRTLFREAVDKGAPAMRGHIAVDDDEGRVQFVTVRVEPVAGQAGEDPLYIVLFHDEGPPLSAEAPGVSGSADVHVAEIEADLRETRERLQSVIEEYETALEELKSSNEELVSVNEELQSTNEELEASKEELQSVNEELHTVNAELHGKVESLDTANDDLQNLFDNTQVAMIFLDRTMKIRTFTPATSQMFNILPSDRGRPLSDLSSQFAMPDLSGDIKAAIESGATKERRIQHDDGRRHFLVRSAPYLGGESRLEGAVVTFVDVSSLAAAEVHHRTLVAELNHRVKNMLAVVIGLAEQTSNTSASLSDFKATFVARLRAMARSYELLSRENWKDMGLGELAARALAAFPGERVSIEGPEIRLRPAKALALGMVLHELTTNAAKYGALNGGNGRVEIRWTLADGRALLDWRERDGPALEGRMTSGFGLRLVERQTEFGLDGHTDFKFSPTGLEARIDFPV